MSVLTIGEARTALGEDAPTDDADLMAMMAGVTSIVEQHCNRKFPKLSSASIAGATTVMFTIPHHGFEAGDNVRIASTRGNSAIDGTFAVNEIGLDTNSFEVTATITQADLDALRFAVRPIISNTLRTRGGQSVMVSWVPLSEIVAVRLWNGNEYETLEATEYIMGGQVVDGLSIVGQVSLLNRQLPLLNARKAIPDWHPAGIQIDYIAGEPYPTADAIYATKSLMESIVARTEASGLSSERYDYYSYQKQAADQIGKLVGDVENTLTKLRIPV